MRALIVITVWFSIFSSALASDAPFDQDYVVTKQKAPDSFSSSESAYCCVTFNVNIKGRAENIETSYCTNSRFSKKSRKALKSWRFEPAFKDGIPVMRTGATTTIVSTSTDQSLYPKPGKDGFLEPREDIGKIPKPPRNFIDLMSWQDTYFQSDKVCPKAAP
ncbi:MAG: energy transducer TonB [Litorimonas sp.]